MRFRTVLFSILYAVLVSTLTSGNVFPDEPATSDSYLADVVRIRELFESRKFPEVTDLLEKYQASCEKDVRWELAVSHAFGIFDVSIPRYKALLDEWVTTLPKSWVPFLARGTYYNELGWKARGGAWAKDTSDDQIRRMQDNLILSAKDVEKALKINQRLFPAYRILMQINTSRGNQEVGSLLLKKALEECPDSYLLRVQHMGLLMPRWGGSHEAMMQFALESAANSGRNPYIKMLPGLVYWDMGRIAEREGKIEQAIDLYEKALTFGESYTVLLSFAEALKGARMPEKALEVVERAIALRPNTIDAYGIRSEIFLSQEKWDDALKDLGTMKLFGGNESDKFVETRKRGGKQVVSQGHSLYRVNKFTQAIEIYTLALRFDPESAEAYCWRGYAFHRTWNDFAEDDFRKAVAIDPRLIDAYEGLDRVLFKRGRLDEIVELWNKYIQLEPGIARAYLERSGTYYHKKDLVSAYRDLKRACDLGNQEGCTRMQGLKEGALRGKTAEIDGEIATGIAGSVTRNAGGAPEKIKTSGGKWSFRDSQGKLLTTEQFDDAWEFRDGYARILQNGKWGFLDMKGNIAIKPQYEYCWDFSGDKAKVRLEDGSTHYVDRRGKEITE